MSLYVFSFIFLFFYLFYLLSELYSVSIMHMQYIVEYERQIDDSISENASFCLLKIIYKLLNIKDDVHISILEFLMLLNKA